MVVINRYNSLPVHSPHCYPAHAYALYAAWCCLPIGVQPRTCSSVAWAYLHTLQHDHLSLLLTKIDACIAEEFGWSESVKGAISSSFFVGYTVTNLVGEASLCLPDRRCCQYGVCMKVDPANSLCMSAAVSTCGG